MTCYFRFFANSSVLGDGFNITYQESCGGNYTQNGELVSPHFPNALGPFECIYTISQTERAFNNLQINQFDLGQWDDGCGLSYLEVRDGLTETSPLIGRFCGTMSDVISSLNSTQNQVQLK